jgi:hypothetical protein
MSSLDKWLLEQIKWFEQQERDAYLTEEEKKVLEELRQYFREREDE